MRSAAILNCIIGHSDIRNVEAGPLGEFFILKMVFLTVSQNNTAGDG